MMNIIYIWLHMVAYGYIRFMMAAYLAIIAKMGYIISPRVHMIACDFCQVVYHVSHPENTRGGCL